LELDCKLKLILFLLPFVFHEDYAQVYPPRLAGNYLRVVPKKVSDNY
jgi:hypothetical protein